MVSLGFGLGLLFSDFGMVIQPHVLLAQTSINRNHFGSARGRDRELLRKTCPDDPTVLHRVSAALADAANLRCRKIRCDRFGIFERAIGCWTQRLRP